MATTKEITLAATSGGYVGGNKAQITIDSQEMGFGTYNRGLNIAVFEETTGLPLFTTHFDTAIGNSHLFANLIEHLPAGRMIALAVQGDAGTLSEPAKAACKSLGSTQIDQLQPYQSYTLIGCQGQAVKSASESLSWLETSSSYPFQVQTPPPSETWLLEILSTPSYFGTDYIPQGGTAQFLLNGNPLTPAGGSQPGWNVLVLDAQNGQLKRSGSFHPWNPQAVEELIQLLQSLQTGEIVAIATQDYAGVQIDARLQQACASIGSTLISQLTYGGNWAIVGYPECQPGHAVENLSSYCPPEYGPQGVRVRYWQRTPPVLAPTAFSPKQTVGAESASAYFAYYNGVSIEGNYALVGDIGKDRVYAYHWQQNQWQLQQMLVPPNQPGSNFGIAIAKSGNWAIVGQSDASAAGKGGAGAAHLYELTAEGQWQHRQVLQPSDLKADDCFGFSVAIAENVAIVGAYCADTPRQKNCGAAYLFQLQGNQWVQAAKWQPRDLKAEDSFGYRVAIAENVAVVGAYYAGVKGKPHCGAAYLFLLSKGTAQPQKLQPDDLSANDYFGYAVAVAGNWAIIGASHADAAEAMDGGAAYLYQWQEGTWQLYQKLQAPDPQKGDYFGAAVGISDKMAVVGTYGADLNGKTDCGAVYLFQSTEEQWELKQKLQPADLPAKGLWGYNVSFDGRRAIAGSYGGYLNPKVGFAYVCDVEESLSPTFKL
jgi:hypothetical protein